MQQPDSGTPYKLLDQDAPLPFLFGPKPLPAQAPNGACRDNANVDASQLVSNATAFSACQASIAKGDVETLRKVFDHFNNISVLDVVTPQMLRDALGIFLKVNPRWQMASWQIDYAPGAYQAYQFFPPQSQASSMASSLPPTPTQVCASWR